MIGILRACLFCCKMGRGEQRSLSKTDQVVRTKPQTHHFDWHYLSSQVPQPNCSWKWGPVGQKVRTFFGVLRILIIALNAKGWRLIESVECERLMIGFLDMAASEIPLVDGAGKTPQDAFQNIFQLKHLFLYGVHIWATWSLLFHGFK